MLLLKAAVDANQRNDMHLITGQVLSIKECFFGGHQFGQHLLTKCCLNVENCHTCIGRTIIGEFD